jgi:hypothetical protein
MTINGPICLALAILVFAFHALHAIEWRRESKERLKQWKEYDEASQRRHDEFMEALSWYRAASGQWSNKRHQA